MLLALVPVWGPALLLIATFLSCLALPIPASLLMLVAGAFSSGGDLSLPVVVIAALAGAVMGDQLGFWIGRSGAGLITRITAGSASRTQLLTRAEVFAAGRGRWGVFLSRWLVSPLGPYVNLIAGVTGMAWAAFTLIGIAGEAVWVGVYTLTGWGFADRVGWLADLASDISGALTAGAVTLALGFALIRAALRARRKARDESSARSPLG